jgi:isoquinoline 1-oxidoreductase beta subunit
VQIDREIAGSFVVGLSALFYPKCTVENGAIEQTIFDTYDPMRIDDMPKVESIIMRNGGSEPWGGVGEPTICVPAPAVLNAYFEATG